MPLVTRRDTRYDPAPHGAVLDGWTARSLSGRTELATTHPSLAAQVRQQIKACYPYAACDDCLAVFVIAPPNEVHQAALVVAKEDGFMRRMRVCYRCRRAVELTAQE
jgi:hypothetical protein